ncbi:hypothetical protein V8G54_030145 [Vigna mungo]|uniref:Uncharacterized protein n=1 Tax=Vigna mungo TaxID=3915 RepID=A0AAQ3MWH8_VIGMU
MVAPFSFRHTGMHCLAHSDRVSALLTHAMVITKQINMLAIVFFEITILFFCKIFNHLNSIMNFHIRFLCFVYICRLKVPLASVVKRKLRQCFQISGCLGLHAMHV